tara:strand:+ start:2850 stop:3197 length:348 start_codon:yes stop_codon:yes gene_type:complete
MKILTKPIEKQLLANSEESQLANLSDQMYDPKPVVKLFDCMGPATWLLTEIDSDGYAFGLCDMGMGFPELGPVFLPELVEALGWRLERDMYWDAKGTLSEYAEVARGAQRIVDLP